MAFSKELNRRLVLVVDDQEINRELLGAILENEYDVLFASDGLQAMEIIHAQKDMLSIILLDLIMPNMDGFAVLEALRANEELRRIPVIVLTAEKSAELKALQLGAADFVTKPFDMHEVIQARVARIIELREGRQLIQTAGIDALTGLYTGSFFFRYGEQMLRYHPDWKLDAAVFNIDRFHSINELYGREFGDKALSTVGEELQDIIASTDGIAGRAEADQFLLLTPHQENVNFQRF
ncbi:MAG: response regulator [Solobacterium sp.]|nr:response regulator [Solobacterium sp.]